MTAVIYTAQQSLTTGHAQGTQYSINLRLADLDPDKDVGKEDSLSMSGKSETVLWRNLKTWAAMTAAVRGEEREIIREFLESVIGGQTFQLDEFGSAGMPDNPVSVVLVGKFKERRAARQGDGGRNDYFRFSFAVRAIP